MAQAMEKDRVIELLEYYKDIDGEVNICRKIISDLTDQYYNPIGAIQCDGLPKGKNNISRQTENMALNIPDYVSGEIREYEAKAQQLQAYSLCLPILLRNLQSFSIMVREVRKWHVLLSIWSQRMVYLI